MVLSGIKKTKQLLLSAITRPHSDNYPADMEWVGIGNIMRAAAVFNHVRYGGVLQARRRLYQRSGNELLIELGSPLRPRGQMVDGLLLDTSLQWPHLDELLEQGEQIIAERGLTRVGVPGREWIRDIFQWTDWEKFPAFLDFIMSPDVLGVVSNYLGFIPSLSTTVPPGVRLTESHQDETTLGQFPYRQSQLFHLDIHCTPMVYVIVLLRDVTEKSGPFCYLSASASDRVTKALKYRKRGKPFRLQDEEVFRVIERSEMKMLTGKAGTVLFLDPSRCFHYGSRDAVNPRYQAMYAYVSPRRADFTQWMMPARVYPRRPNEKTIQRLILDTAARQ